MPMIVIHDVVLKWIKGNAWGTHWFWKQCTCHFKSSYELGKRSSFSRLGLLEATGNKGSRKPRDRNKGIDSACLWITSNLNITYPLKPSEVVNVSNKALLCLRYDKNKQSVNRCPCQQVFNKTRKQNIPVHFCFGVLQEKNVRNML